MWDAKATRNGEVVYDWENNHLADSALQVAFEQAGKELLRQSGMTSDDMLALGWIAYSETREPLEIATGRKCTNGSSDGIMYWSAEEVSQINSTINWGFVYQPDFGEDDY